MASPSPARSAPRYGALTRQGSCPAPRPAVVAGAAPKQAPQSQKRAPAAQRQSPATPRQQQRAWQSPRQPQAKQAAPFFPPPRLVGEQPELDGTCRRRQLDLGDRARSTATCAAAPEAARAAPKRLAVIAPGAGVFTNGAVYGELGRGGEFKLDIVGQAGSAYDKYPQWFPGGQTAPNLDSFAGEVLEKGTVRRADVLVVGSRGGQVVLPRIWQSMGESAPPAVVINGGCAMGLPKTVHWPKSAVSLLLMGGRDNFRANKTPEEYVADAKRRVPGGNRSTAILYVNEMPHMPPAELLGAALPHMLRGALRWKEERRAPVDQLQALVAAISKAGPWSGRLMYTNDRGEWQELPFGGKAQPAPAREAPEAAKRGRFWGPAAGGA